ncbi:hypothetical protein [Kribbella sp. NPDC000426]|uniref:hypothetical protein n=1 Tax=Kribbella sp. NPDC000426 TaxID=3154255 RepID=UPI00331B2C95
MTGPADTGGMIVATTDVMIGPVAAVDTSAMTAVGLGGTIAVATGVARTRGMIVEETAAASGTIVVDTGGMTALVATVAGTGVTSGRVMTVVVTGAMSVLVASAVGIGTRGRATSAVGTTGTTGPAIRVVGTTGMTGRVTRVGAVLVRLVVVGRRVGSVELSGGMTVAMVGGTSAVGTGGTSAPATTVVGTAVMTAVTRGVATGGTSVRARLVAGTGGMSGPVTRAVGTTGMTGAVTRGGVGGTIGVGPRGAMSGVADLAGRTARRRPGLVGTTPRFRKGSRVPSSIVV